ncbi:class I SAM-dependent methyltransferase [Roseovarius faecimaris]|uniref:Class I SAM-dependent methyltransferase n=1 Tax=Roseovarius faecimaris TaxID=2494550 RepID=A0A6I6IM16_9RHOB|nr:class I SAM-dependent methyltransferase [Roseovarius faecimaris]QGX96823.1 class I SAM-dependent methyltransferase [Roseovarius faecimaris]
MTPSAKFWDRAASRYAKSPIRDMQAYTYTRERTRSYLTPDSTALELGCGTGSTALELAPSLGHITGTDISLEMIGIARQKAATQGVENVRFVTADASGQMPESGPYDVVLAHNLWHLVPDTEEAIARVHEQVKPGGLFISKTPCLGQPGMSWKIRLMLLAIPVLQWLGKAPFVRRFSIDELEGIITSRGFEIIESGNFPADPPSRYIVARRV